MNIKDFIKKRYKILIAISLLSLSISIIFLKQIGKKDAVMVFAATFLLLLEIYIASIDRKKSILLFILSFPILVTARKICYFASASIRLNYEIIYITILFILSIKDVKAYLKRSLKKDNTPEFKYITLIALLVIFAINSISFSQNIVMSLSETYMGLIAPIMFMLCVVSIFTKEDRFKIYYMLIGGLNLSCFYGFFQIFANRIPLNEISRNRALITFGYHNINIFAGILTITLPFIMDMILYKDNTKKEKRFLYISMIICLTALVLTFTRGAWMSFAISIFIILISKKYKKILYFLLAISLFLAKPLLSLMITRGGTTVSFFQNESVIARLQSIFTSIRMMVHYPFGIGAGNFESMYKNFAMEGYFAMPQSFRTQITTANYTLENAHNLWLQIGVEFGVVCSIIFFIIVLNRIALLFKNYSENRANFTSIVIFLIYTVLTGMEFNHKGVITETLIVWIIFAIISLNSSESPKTSD
jgi:O-antigen ligase